MIAFCSIKASLFRLHKFSLLLLLAVTLLCLAIPANAEQLIADSLSSITVEGPPNKPFSFAIAGNTRHSLPYLISPHFQSIITQVDEQQSEFFILLGDLIRGRNISTAARQWDEFQASISASSIPILPVAGEHDIWNYTSRQLWEQRMGPPWYSFDYQDSHFIILNTEENPRLGISGEQFKWLKWDLDSVNAVKNIFIFIHRPLFLDYASNWEKVHKLLKRYPVKAVFAAHHPRYEMFQQRDGITYYITGGGGSEILELPELGGFSHWLLVTVDGTKHRVSVMQTDRRPLPDYTVRSQNRPLILAARRAISMKTIKGRMDMNLVSDAHVFIKNPTHTPFAGNINWHIPGAGWECKNTRHHYKIGRYGKAEIYFPLRATETALLGPLPFIDIDYFYGNYLTPIKLTYGLPVVRNVSVSPATTRVIADGKLNEWEGIEPLALINRLGTEPASEDDLSGAVRMMWSPKRFYVALEVKDDIITRAAENAEGEWDIDHFSLTFDPYEKGTGSSRSTRYEYQGSLCAKGARLYLLSGPFSAYPHRLASNVEMGVTRKNGTITYELAFNNSSLSPLSLQAGEKFAMNLLVGDDDGPRHPEKFTLLALVGKGATPHEPWPHIIVQLAP